MMCIFESHQPRKQIDETVKVYESLVGLGEHLKYTLLPFFGYIVIRIPIKILLHCEFYFIYLCDYFFFCTVKQVSKSKLPSL